MKYRVKRSGVESEIAVERAGDGFQVREPGGAPQLIRFEELADGSLRAITPWGDVALWAARRQRELWASWSGQRFNAQVERHRPSGGAERERGSAGDVLAPMPGKLLRVLVELGDSVQAGQPIAVIEAMKMENELLAPQQGVVEELLVRAPSTLEKGALVARIKAP